MNFKRISLCILFLSMYISVYIYTLCILYIYAENFSLYIFNLYCVLLTCSFPLQTMNFKATVEGPHSSIVGLRFQLLASSAEGTVGRVFILYPGPPHTQPRPITPSTASTTTLPPTPTSTSVSRGMHPYPSLYPYPNTHIHALYSRSIYTSIPWGQGAAEPLD